MSRRRVVVTGMGMVSPLGNDLVTSWDGIKNGRSGIGPLTSFDASTFATRICGEVRDWTSASSSIPRKPRRWMPSSITAWRPR